MATPPSADNLLELYRQHRDEIDAITDPVTLFILAYGNHSGEIRLNALAKELGLSSAALNKTLLPLYRSGLITESGEMLRLTPLGKRVLEELGFAAPPIPPTKPSEPPKQSPKPPKQPPQPPAPPAAAVGGIALRAAAVVLIGALIIGVLVLPGILNPPTLPPTRAPLVSTQPPVTVLRQVTTTREVEMVAPEKTHTITPTASHTFTPIPAYTFAPALTRTPTPTLTRTSTATRTRTPTVDTQGPPAPTALAPVGSTLVSCSGSKILRWSSVSDPAGIARYEWVLERSSSGAAGPYSSFASGNTSSLTATPAMQCGSWYRWRVRAVDGLGNAGAYCAYAYFSIGID